MPKAEVYIEGSLGKQNDFNVSKNGTEYVRFSVAVTPRVKDSSGNYVNDEKNTSWYLVTQFGKQARSTHEMIAKSIEANGGKSGIPVVVKGNIQVIKFNNDKGVETTAVQVRADSVSIQTTPWSFAVYSRVESNGGSKKGTPVRKPAPKPEVADKTSDSNGFDSFDSDDDDW